MRNVRGANAKPPYPGISTRGDFRIRKIKHIRERESPSHKAFRDIPESGGPCVIQISFLFILESERHFPVQRLRRKPRAQAINQLRALLVSAPQEIRERLLKTKTAECVASCARLRSLGDTPMLQTLTTTLRLLAKRWLALAEELNTLDAMLDRLTSQHASRLRDRFGVGPQTAAVLVAVAGDNPERLKSEAALAALCGTSPLQASSGKTTRHRLNRGGDRSANNALWTIAMVRMRSDPRTRAYVERRTKEGMSNKEVHRCLKRYIVRELYPLILADLADSTRVP
nr:transposase [Burkholderia gladioli]